MLTDFAATYVGRPFAEGARDLDADGGLDCWGLVRQVYARERGIVLPRFSMVATGDAESIGRAICSEQVSTRWSRVNKRTPQVFDVVTMRRRGSKLESHCGVIAPGRRLLHCERQSGVVCVMLEHPAIVSRICGIWRYGEPA